MLAFVVNVGIGLAILAVLFVAARALNWLLGKDTMHDCGGSSRGGASGR